MEAISIEIKNFAWLTKQGVVGKGVMCSNPADVKLKSVFNGMTSKFLDAPVLLL